MAAESHPAPGVGPQASSVSMPPEALPPELWHTIIALLDDHCFAWHVLRRVSPYFRLVTEDVFARCMLRTCSLRFAGEPAKNLLPSDLQETVRIHHNDYTHDARRRPFYQLPSFRFRPLAFVPASTKAKIILKLSDPTSDREFTLVHQGQAIQLPSSHRLAELFFEPGAEADSNRKRLINESHFVRFNSQLKSIRIPSLVIDVVAREITLDWRQLCQDFLCDEYKCRLNCLGSWSMRLLSE